jgi:hypothetical protein
VESLYGCAVLGGDIFALLAMNPIGKAIAALRIDEGCILVYHPDASRVLTNQCEHDYKTDVQPQIHTH